MRRYNIFRTKCRNWGTKPLKIDGPNGPLFITQGQSFGPGALFLGIELAKELDRMAAIQRAASKLAGGAFASAA